MSLTSWYSDQMELLNRLFLGYAGPPFSIQFPLWSWHSDGYRHPVFSLILRSSEAFSRLLQASETGLGEAFVSGQLDIEGDIVAAFAMHS
jgi:hypothetical protein